MKTFCITKISYIMHNVQDYKIPNSNDVRLVICKGWHFTHTWNGLVWPHHFI